MTTYTARIVAHFEAVDDTAAQVELDGIVALLSDGEVAHDIQADARVSLRQGDPIDVCAGCGQTLLTTPDDPMRSLWCDTCEGGAK